MDDQSYFLLKSLWRKLYADVEDVFIKNMFQTSLKTNWTYTAMLTFRRSVFLQC